MPAKLRITPAQIWTADILDEPGGLDSVLAPLAEAGADLHCLIARRKHDGASQPQSGILYLTPLKSKKAQAAAASVNLRPAEGITTLVVQGPNRQGLAHQIAQALAKAGINLRGFTALVLGRNFVAYLGFDSPDDAAVASKAIKRLPAAAGRRRKRVR
jgi:hypothetical protein